MPSKEFAAVSNGNKNVEAEPFLFSTPAGSSRIINQHFFDTIKIGRINYPVTISSNNNNKEMLIGTAFFQRFRFVIFDYINKAVYVSNYAQ